MNFISCKLNGVNYPNKFSYKLQCVFASCNIIWERSFSELQQHLPGENATTCSQKENMLFFYVEDLTQEDLYSNDQYGRRIE